MTKKPEDRYSESGVDINYADAFVKRIKKRVQGATRPEVIGGIGGFAGLFRLNKEGWKKPVLVGTTDGVGTKLLVAQMAGNVSTIGIDLVAMCVNDLVVCGAEPLFFLDYLACGSLQSVDIDSILEGIVVGCKQAGAALLGGETAEMPDTYKAGEFDLAGFAVGIVDEESMLDHTRVRSGDVLIGISSSGLHSNGYSLVRNILFKEQQWAIDRHVEELGCTLAEELLRPTRIYTGMIESLLRQIEVHAIVHITGGGLTDNIPRVLPSGCTAEIRTKSWHIPPIFQLLQRLGNVSDAEMFRVFNCGVGMVLAVPRQQAAGALETLTRMGERAFQIGEVRVDPRSKKEPVVTYVSEGA